MNVALVTIGDRGDLYRPQMLASMAEHVDYRWSAEVHIDDSDHGLGMAGAVNAAWSQVPPNTDYVFHVEEDFLFLRPAPVEHICRTLEANPRLAQLVLQRQPLSPAEQASGGVVGPHLGDVVVQPSWVEHRSIFSLNPCVCPAGIVRDGWPAGNEAEFTARMLAAGHVFGFWGSPTQEPDVWHIGLKRGEGWRL